MDSIIAALAIVGLVLGGGAFTGLLVFAVARFESSRMRRGVRAFAARLEQPVFEDEPLARAWKVLSVRGSAGGFRMHVTTKPGAPMQLPTTSGGHTNHRMLFSTITLEFAEGASAARLGPVPSDDERARWEPSIRADGARGRAELHVDPLTSEAAVARCWVGVRVAATMLAEARAMTPERDRVRRT